jgi:predicted glycosyltransferase
MSAAPAVFLHVQHLRGTGHAFRAARIAQALRRAGARVFLAWGGTAVPGIDLAGLEVAFLPPVKSPDDEYRKLVAGDGTAFSEEAKSARRDRLLDFLARARPDVVVTETWPFGRRLLRFELEPLIAAAAAMRPRPRIVSSVRDILQENRKQSSVAESFDAFAAAFDGLLVHGDPGLVRIGETLPGAGSIADRIRYTGIVAPPPPDMTVPPSLRADVVVAAGGGAFGQRLTAAALSAMALSARHPRNWVVIAGSQRDEAELGLLEAQAPEGLRVVRHVPDFARVIADAKVVAAMAGYNTVADIMRVRARAVLVPYAAGNQTEQLRRAETLRSRGLATVVAEDALSPAGLAQAIDAAAARPRPEFDFDLEGAANSARILLELAASARS